MQLTTRGLTYTSSNATAPAKSPTTLTYGGQSCQRHSSPVAVLLNRRWNDWVCALTTVALLSLSFWTNSSPLEQASPSLQPTVFSDSLLLD